MPLRAERVPGLNLKAASGLLLHISRLQIEMELGLWDLHLENHPDAAGSHERFAILCGWKLLADMFGVTQ